MARLRIEISADDIVNAKAKTLSMSEAAKLLNVSFATFKRRSMELGLYKPNQGKPGVSRPSNEKYRIEDILSGKHPQYGSNKLKRRLIELGLKSNECEICNITSWQDKQLVFHLDHIDGNSFNNALSNLQILCPNCHSQTPTYCRGIMPL